MIKLSLQKKKIKKKYLNFQDFDAISISLASPKQIREWSYGEVKKADTIDYRTFKYERDGLFCERIFGPSRDWHCACGKYKYVKYKGLICDRCGVEVTESKVRRERMGHIELAAPVAHIWFVKKIPSRIGTLLDLNINQLEKIIYYSSYILLEDLKENGSVVMYKGRLMKEKELIDSEEYEELKARYGNSLKAEIGAAALQKLLEKINLEKEEEKLNNLLKVTKNNLLRSYYIKKLKIIQGFIRSKTRPEWMILTVLPVIPPDLRPIVPLEGGKFASSDLNDIYRKIINRNNRLKEIIQKKAPTIMINNEKRLLQQVVDTLLETPPQPTFPTGAGSKPLKSLADFLKGKQGRFRQNLLGKRVDYSGRSVIVVDPELKLNQCGISKDIILELFTPFIIGELIKSGELTIKMAKRMIEKRDPQIWEIVERLIKRYPVLLNRAPTLHKVSMQGFYPVLKEGKAIHIHPLVCTSYNADFDGDQMAVHIPLSFEAQTEVKLLMMASHNILSPAHGEPLVTPTQDMILGCCYLTSVKKGEKGEGMIFSSPEEVITAYQLGVVDMHARIKIAGINKIDGERDVNKWDDFTTPGRVIFNSILPNEMRFINERMTKKKISKMISECYKKFGPYVTVKLLDDLKSLGFYIATISGISISLGELQIPPQKEAIIKEAQKQVEEIERQAKENIITESERYNKIIDLWTGVTEKIAELMVKEMKKTELRPKSEIEPHFNSVYMMAEIGARGNIQQIRQLSGTRGLITKPQRKLTDEIGGIIETPITSNFREGLSIAEYFISTHGGRKGLADTALKTADAGYLTRRLIDVAHNIVVTMEDCGTVRGIKVSELRTKDRVLESLEERIVGRVALQNIVSFLPNEKGEYELFVKEGDVITPEAARKIVESGISEIQIRSVLTCEADYGVCAKCYGVNLAKGRLVEVSEPVGIIAAQSIGEPGTQLTLRTFHIGGTASRLLYQSEIVAEERSKVEFHNIRAVKDRHGDFIALTRNGELVLFDLSKKKRSLYRLPYGAKIKVKNGAIVEKGTQVAVWDPYALPVVAECKGKVKYFDIIEGKTLRLEKSKVTGVPERTIVEFRGQKPALRPRISILDEKNKIIKTYLLPADTILVASNNQNVESGDLLAKIPQEVMRIVDITGGLPRIIELFEARHPKNKALISEIDGKVALSTTPEGFPKVTIIPEKGKSVEYIIPRGRHLLVYDGDIVSAGEPLTDGVVDLHDISKIQKHVAEFLVNEIQKVYRLQGVEINDKHIEIIVSRMLSNVKIVDPGDSYFITGEIVPKKTYERERERLEKEKKLIARKKGKAEAAKIKLPEAETVLLGITKAAFSTESFISAASFQETTRVLTEAAISKQIDAFRGPKENVIVGKLIPAGSGWIENKVGEKVVKV